MPASFLFVTKPLHAEISMISCVPIHFLANVAKRRERGVSRLCRADNGL